MSERRRRVAGTLLHGGQGDYALTQVRVRFFRVQCHATVCRWSWEQFEPEEKGGAVFNTLRDAVRNWREQASLTLAPHEGVV